MGQPEPFLPPVGEFQAIKDLLPEHRKSSPGPWKAKARAISDVEALSHAGRLVDLRKTFTGTWDVSVMVFKQKVRRKGVKQSNFWDS